MKNLSSKKQRPTLKKAVARKKIKSMAQPYSTPEPLMITGSRDRRKLNLKKVQLTTRKTIRHSFSYSHDWVYRDVLCEARALRIQEGWAKTIAERVANYTDNWIADKPVVTRADLERAIVRKLEELNPDIAYAYKNKDRVI